MGGTAGLLFSNADTGPAGGLTETTAEDWRHLIEVNLMASCRRRAFLPRAPAQSRRRLSWA